MKSFITLVFLIISASSLSGQSDKEATELLDRFSSKAMNAAAIYMEFDLVSIDIKENSRDTINGSLLLSKDKYKLDLGNNIVWSDGVTSWSYLIAEKEVTINKIDKKDNSFQTKPSELFTMYRKGYKNRLVEERQDSYIIDLYPEDLNNELQRVRLTLSKSTFFLRNVEYRRKDGVSVNLVLNVFDLSRKPDPDGYIFKPEKYKGVEIIDMR
jgi:outer membrane lipoprotein carrier protein